MELLTDITNDSKISSDSNPDFSASSLSSKSLEDVLNILSNEKQKLRDFEMVIAVVGTMKAGKSTVINAIVGNEVVPNRNRPMTALPTLITHTVGQEEPILEFSNDQPVNELLALIKKSLNKPEFGHVIEKHQQDKDMNELLTMIMSGGRFDQQYPDRESIYLFLRLLNDLVRLAKDLNLGFPFNKYRNTENLPRIKVEFTHLEEMEQAQGKLTLLDTPGPNEEGQDHLKRMLGEQLKRASAVLAVLDYTQLKSDADADVRRQLNDIASLNEGRLFALVNRYDQKDKNSDGIEETKSVVAKQLMKGSVSEDDIFPVSARYAYLSNRAKHELSKNGKLPELNEGAPAWVEDYVDFIVGNPRHYRSNDEKAIQIDVDYGWEKSKFSEPLDIVIKSAHEKSALIVVSSVSSKLNDYVGKLERSIQTRKASLSKTLEEIEYNIKAIQSDIEAVQQSSNKAIKDLEAAFKQADKEVQSGYTALIKITNESLEKYFAEGKRLEKISKQHKATQDDKERKQNQSWFFGVISQAFKDSNNKREQSKDQDFDPTDPIIEFESRRDADAQMDKIHQSVESEFKLMESALKKGISTALKGFNAELDRTAENAQKQITGMEERLAKENIKLSLKLPDIQKLDVEFAVFDVLDGMVKEETVTKTDERRKSGLWGGFVACLVLRNGVGNPIHTMKIFLK